MSASVLANLLLFQSHHEPRGKLAQADNRAYRMGAPAPAPAPKTSVDQAADTVRAIQRELKSLNLYPGHIDGKASALLNAAIVAWEQAQALPLTGEPTQALLGELIVGPSARQASGGAMGFGITPGSAAERLLQDIRRKLVTIGYSAGSTEGRMTRELIEGIRAFERDNGMPQTGRVSPQLVIQLQRSVAAFQPRSG